jgi:drug/metabolite transporter (DMT)-like permease
MTTSSTSADTAATASANFVGIGWMLVTGVLFVGVTGIVRHLGSDMNPIQAAFLRYAIGLAILVPLLFRRRTPRLRIRPILSRRLGLIVLRGLVHAMGVMLWFYAMARIPIAEVTALGFSAPIFTTIGAAFFLGERPRIRRVGAVLVGFGGALVILRPGIETVEMGAIAQLTAAPLFATSFLIAKKLTETESSTSIVAYLSIFVTLALLPPALVVWRAPTWDEIGWLFAAATIATLGHFSLTQAFRATEITVTQPFSFLQLVWATLLGFYVFDESPDVWTWVGGAIIVGSATYIMHREALSRAQRGKAMRRESGAAAP